MVRGVGQRASQSVELGNDESVAGSTSGQALAQSGPLPVGPGQTLVDVGPVGADAERGEGVSLGGEVLLLGRDTGIADE